MMRFTPFLTLCFLLTISVITALPTHTTPHYLMGRNEHHGQGHDHYTPHNIATSRPSASGQSRKREAPQIIPANLPLGTRNDLARCPAELMACPIVTMTVAQAINSNSEVVWECVSPDEDLYSCGGCATLGTGTDCTTIPGVSSVSCSTGRCSVHSCRAGFVKSADGVGCVAALVSQ